MVLHSKAQTSVTMEMSHVKVGHHAHKGTDGIPIAGYFNSA
jgi:hypothetical protein